MRARNGQPNGTTKKLILTTHDEDGLPWRFDGVRMKNGAVRKAINGKPLAFIGSTLCTNYYESHQSRQNGPRRNGAKHGMCKNTSRILDKRVRGAMAKRRGGDGLHEHPAGASSWQDAKMRNLMGRDGIQRVVGDQCQSWLKSTEEENKCPNECCMLRQEYKQKVHNKLGHQTYRQTTLENGKPERNAGVPR